MKICVAQTKALKGKLRANISNHIKWIETAVAAGADLIVFPELSLTGYEPELARELATNLDDTQFEAFQKISDSKQITICAGMPTIQDSNECISLLIFQPNKSRQLYSKKYLHPDEKPFFVSGSHCSSVTIEHTHIAFAICYELSVPQHSEDAKKKGAGIYIVSAAKTAAGVNNAAKSLSEIAQKHAMTVLMSNCVGHCDHFNSGGKTAIWNGQGKQLGQLDDTNEGLLLIDTATQEVIKKTT